MNLNGLKRIYDLDIKLSFHLFWGGFLSNWYESNFEVDGVSYWCTEQYIKSKKTELFGDLTTQQAIMNSKDQREIKNLGRTCKGFNQVLWDKEKEKIVFDGCYAKFTQSEMLKIYLRGTKDKILVNASPFDRIWGIGLGEESGAYTFNPYNWRGTNLLGFILMDVRDKILLEV